MDIKEPTFEEFTKLETVWTHKICDYCSKKSNSDGPVMLRKQMISIDKLTVKPKWLIFIGHQPKTPNEKHYYYLFPTYDRGQYKKLENFICDHLFGDPFYVEYFDLSSNQHAIYRATWPWN